MSNPPLVNTQPKELNDAPSSQSIHITEPSATDLEEQEAPTSSCRVDVSTTVTAIQISTTPSDGQLSTSTQSLKRKLPSSDCPSPSKQSSNVSHLQQVKTSRRMAFGGVVTPWAPERWTSDMKNFFNELLATQDLQKGMKKLHRLTMKSLMVRQKIKTLLSRSLQHISLMKVVPVSTFQISKQTQSEELHSSLQDQFKCSPVSFVQSLLHALFCHSHPSH